MSTTEKKQPQNSGPFYLRIARGKATPHTLRKQAFAQIVDAIEFVRTHKAWANEADYITVVYSNGRLAVRVK